MDQKTAQQSSKSPQDVKDNGLDIAIVGCGIIGTILALGLIKRNIKVQVYDQAQDLRQIGAGIAFTANARKCMSIIDQRIVDCVTTVATINGDPDNPNYSMQYIDGYTHDPANPDDMTGKKLYKLYAGPRGFEGCHRAQFLEEVLKLMPDGVVHLSKRVEDVSEQTNGKMLLTFGDGTSATADAVIGCDGIKSRVRQIVLGEDNPASYPHYTHKFAFRGLVPMDQAIAKLGKYRALTQHLYGGPRAHLIHFPVAKQKLMNVVAFVADPTDWPLDLPMSQPATKDEVVAAFAAWGPTVRSIVDLLPPETDKWGTFDALDYPAPTYCRDKIVLAGDAAHAATPHHGAGAGIGAEDALALCTLLELIQRDVNFRGIDKGASLRAAFLAFSAVRYERTQWVVRSSRQACEIYEWIDSECRSDMAKGHEEITRRSHKIWYFDIDGMLDELDREYSRLIAPDV